MAVGARAIVQVAISLAVMVFALGYAAGVEDAENGRVQR